MSAAYKTPATVRVFERGRWVHKPICAKANKVSHPSREAALEQAGRLDARNPRGPRRKLRAYPCNACMSWHVGTRVRE